MSNFLKNVPTTSNPRPPYYCKRENKVGFRKIGPETV